MGSSPSASETLGYSPTQVQALNGSMKDIYDGKKRTKKMGASVRKKAGCVALFEKSFKPSTLSPITNSMDEPGSEEWDTMFPIECQSESIRPIKEVVGQESRKTQKGEIDGAANKRATPIAKAYRTGKRQISQVLNTISPVLQAQQVQDGTIDNRGRDRAKMFRDGTASIHWNPLFPHLEYALQTFSHNPIELRLGSNAVREVLEDMLRPCPPVNKKPRISHSESLVSKEMAPKMFEELARYKVSNDVPMKKVDSRGESVESEEASSRYISNDFLHVTESVSNDEIRQTFPPFSSAHPRMMKKCIEPYGELEKRREIRNSSLNCGANTEAGRGIVPTEKPTTSVNGRRGPKMGASRFCHICTRSSKSMRFAKCCRVESGNCRKIVCERCAAEYGWEDVFLAIRNSAFADKWSCTHCRQMCPERAQCATYKRVNSQRREKRLCGGDTGEGGHERKRR